MTYQGRFVDVEETRDQLFRLWAANLPPARDPAAKLRWMYREGPHGQGQAFLLHAQEEPVGCAGVGVRTLSERGMPLRAALFADLAVDRRHRSGLAAITLVRSLQAHVMRDFDLGYGFPTANALAVYRRAGCHVLGPMPRYVRVLRSRALLSQHLAPWLARPASAVVDGSLRALAHLHARSSLDGFELRWPADFTRQHDALWREVAKTRAIACVRDQAFLRWRFLRQPGQYYRIATLHDVNSDELHAYAVVRVRAGGEIEISDLLAASDRDMNALLGRLVRSLTRQGATSISLRYFGGSQLPRILLRHGFTRRDDERSVIFASGRRTRMYLRDPEAWYLTDLDDEA